MTWFYVCRNCGETKAFGSAGKGAIQVVKVYGECCYSIEDEIKQIYNNGKGIVNVRNR